MKINKRLIPLLFVGDYAIVKEVNAETKTVVFQLEADATASVTFSNDDVSAVFQPDTFVIGDKAYFNLRGEYIGTAPAKRSETKPMPTKSSSGQTGCGFIRPKNTI